MPDEFGKNRIVFVREDIKPEDTPSCKVYGLDTDERELVRLKSIDIKSQIMTKSTLNDFLYNYLDSSGSTYQKLSFL